jgi:RNA polymerase sigma-70 factor (ECF subfamily)
MRERTPDANAHALEHWRAAYGLAWALVGDAGHAEEIAQEAFVRLNGLHPDRRDGEHGSDGRALRPLLLATVRNLAVDRLRRRELESLDGALDDAASAHASLDAGPVELAEARERGRIVLEGLATLSPTWRAALYLRDGLSLSYREIAEVLGRSEDVVRVTLHRARARMRELLAARLPEGETR